MYLPITITGIDQKTDLSKLPVNCEIGILYTETPEGRNRYPSMFEIIEMVNYLHEVGYRIALHVCGTSARKTIMSLGAKGITDKIQRIQVNGTLNLEEVNTICRLYPEHTIITQHNWKNSGLLSVQHHNHAVLIDASGGNGITPSEWIAPITSKQVGFAGGLSPENIISEYDRIKPLTKDGFWLDMEGKLRDDNDWFNVERANTVSEHMRSVFV